MALLGCAMPLNIGSTLRTSGSVKYVVGAPLGPKSRGGDVIVLGGATGPPCARAIRGATTTAPAARPILVSSARRERGVCFTMSGRSDAMGILPDPETLCAASRPPGDGKHPRMSPRIVPRRGRRQVG